MILNTKPEGGCGFGNPRPKCLYDAEADMETLGIKSWRIDSEDRDEWTVIVKEVKANVKALKPEEEGKKPLRFVLWKVMRLFAYF
jgi:hypothetical protein